MRRNVFGYASYAVICCAILLLVPTKGQCEHIEFITEPLPPLSYEHNGKMQGYNIELLNMIWKKMGVPPTGVQVQPWARSIKEFDSDTPTCLFPVALAKKRKDEFRYVESPIFFEPVLISKKENASKFKTIEQIKRSKICVLKDVGCIFVLKRLGFNQANFDYCPSHISNVRKFMKGRSPIIGADKVSILHVYQELGGNPADLQVILEMPKTPNGFLFNDAVSDEYVAKFKMAMQEITATQFPEQLYNTHLNFSIPEKP